MWTNWTSNHIAIHASSCDAIIVITSVIIAEGVAWPSQDFAQKNNMGDESQSRSLQIERRWTSSSRARHKVTKSQTGGEVQLQDSGSSQEPATDWLAIIKVTQQQSAKTVDEQFLYYRNWQQYPKHELKTLYLIFLSKKLLVKVSA